MLVYWRVYPQIMGFWAQTDQTLINIVAWVLSFSHHTELNHWNHIRNSPQNHWQAVLGSKSFTINGQQKFVKHKPFCFWIMSIHQVDGFPRSLINYTYGSWPWIGRFTGKIHLVLGNIPQVCCSKPNSGVFSHLDNPWMDHWKTMSFHQKQRFAPLSAKVSASKVGRFSISFGKRCWIIRLKSPFIIYRNI